MNTAAIGTYWNAGLPNITGNFHLGSTGAQETYGNGAFWINTGAAYGGDDNNGKSTGYQVVFSAQSSNNIYGSSNTVQVPAITMRYYIKY